MKKFRIFASVSDIYVLEIEAENEEIALQIADDSDVEKWTKLEPGDGWDIYNTEEINDENN